MRDYQYDHVHLRSPDSDATASFHQRRSDPEQARQEHHGYDIRQQVKADSGSGSTGSISSPTRSARASRGALPITSPGGSGGPCSPAPASRTTRRPRSARGVSRLGRA